MKEDERPVKSLSNTQIKKLLSTAKPYKTMWMRILLALGTGLRLRDIESWRISDIHFENSSVTTRSKKTGKSMGSRPVPVPIMVELKKYVSGLDAKQKNLFNDNFSRYRWKKIRYYTGRSYGFS
ncbi:MAG: tyrosine-type recombinase/integrase [Phycisphaerae bacterium]